MKIQIKQTLLIAALVVSGSLTLVSPAAVYAQTDNWEVGSGNESTTDGVAENGCGGAPTSIIKCDEAAGEDAIISLLRFTIQLMTMGVGILAVGGIIYAGILYSSAAGSQEQIKKAKTMIFNVVIGLVAFAFMVSILEFLIPGGVFN